MLGSSQVNWIVWLETRPVISSNNQETISCKKCSDD